MSSPNKKKKTTPQSTPNPSLPDDLLVTCLSRVSRLHYPAMSFVSKSFRSLLASPELYKARSLLGRTESCLYVCFSSSSGYHWFTLCRKPNQTLTYDTSKKENSSRYVLATLSISHSHAPNRSSLVAVGSNIYNIGGTDIYGEHSSRVSILDCQSHMWREGPILPVELWKLSASVLDERIYVAGCYIDDVESNSFKNSFEVFDTKTQSWDPKPIPCGHTKGTFFNTSVCIDGKFYVEADNEVVAYNPKEVRWDMVECKWWYSMFLASPCVIENVLYSVFHMRSNDSGVLTWYDTDVNKWRNLKGLVGLPKFPKGACVRFADYGGKMAVLWDESSPLGGPLVKDMKKVWCAVIELERRYNYEIWGTVEWFDHVLTVPRGYGFEKVLAAIV